MSQRFPGYPNQGYPNPQAQNPQMMQQQQMQQQMQQQGMMYNRPNMQQAYPQQQGFQQGYPMNQNPQFQQRMGQPQYPYNQGQFQNQFPNQQQQPQQQFQQQQQPQQGTFPQQQSTEGAQMEGNQMNPMMNQNQMNQSQPMMNQHNQGSMQPHAVNQQAHPNVMSPGTAGAQQVMQNQPNPVTSMNQQGGPTTPGQPMTPTPGGQMGGPSTPGQPMTPGQVSQISAPQEPSPPPTRPRNIFDELLESYEDVFARLIAKDEMSGCHDKDEVSVGVEYSVTKFISRAQDVELYFNQMIAKQSARHPHDVLTEEIKDLRAEIHRKDQWIDKMHNVAKKWTEKMLPDEQQPPAKRGKDSKDTHMSALENMSTNPNYRKK